MATKLISVLRIVKAAERSISVCVVVLPHLEDKVTHISLVYFVAATQDILTEDIALCRIHALDEIQTWLERYRICLDDWQLLWRTVSSLEKRDLASSTGGVRAIVIDRYSCRYPEATHEGKVTYLFQAFKKWIHVESGRFCRTKSMQAKNSHRLDSGSDVASSEG